MRFVDLAIILAYLIAITWFGARFRKSQASLRDYFLGGRHAPWWAISLSIVSAETSTLTIVGTPGLSFAGNLGFLQIVFGYLLARVVISLVFLPQYFRGEMFTAYELMRRRFGDRVRRLTASIFLVTRALAEGVRVFAISLVISIVLGTGEAASIILIVCLTLFYTFEGGMTAVIWTDVVQMCLYVVGAVVSLFVILAKIPGGWAHVAAVAGQAGKFQVFDFSFSPSMQFFSRTYTFWAGLVGGCFLTTASHGTDQLMVQRLLSARNEAQSRAALLSSWLVVFVQFSLFLLIGVLLFVYYQDTRLVVPALKDRIYPEFVWRHLPIGVAGLVTAAILAAAMANLSAALNSLASTTVMDIVRPLRRRADTGSDLMLARSMTVIWGVVLVAIGMLARHWGSVLESGLSIASVTLGLLLGVFLLGVLTKRVGERAAIVGVLAGLATILYVRFATPIAWTWWVLIGSAATFAAGYGASFFPSRTPETSA
ncbi:MAG: sodium:solute symporter [Bryobacteraceae bacterium]|jgi:SSS family transporter